MTDAKRTILARRARFIAAALAGVGCTPPATQGAQSVVIPPLDAGAVSSPIAAVAPDPREASAPPASRPDRDRDGIDDDDDACPDEPGAPSDVARNNGCPPRVIVSVCLSIVAPPKVTFAPGGATPTATSALDAIASVMSSNPQIAVEIEGHTDSTEAPALGQQRADAVLRELVKRGVAQTRMTTSNAKATKPVAPNTTAVGRAKNRRVELVVR